MSDGDAMAWAQEQFGAMELGDRRRTARLVKMAASAARRPAGTVTAVFDDDAERQGAYDFLESGHISFADLEAGVGEAAARACASEKRVIVAVDGSSLTFVDRTGERGLGAVGTFKAGAHGIKVINAMAISADGVPISILSQVAWRRPVQRSAQRRPASKRPIDKKETRHWLQAVRSSAERVDAATDGTSITFVVDREGDSAAMLTTLGAIGHDFIVRGNWDRTVTAADGRRWKVRNLLAYQKPLGSYELKVVARPGRSARTACIELAAVAVTYSFKDPTSRKPVQMKLSAVRAREIGTTPDGEDPIDWLLLTPRPITTLAEARACVVAYTYRWRIEEFHRSWKSGRCNVEDSQLRSLEALEKWALMLATVAVRIERLKLRARAEPDAPATLEFSAAEVQAIILLKRRSKPEIPIHVPTLAQATLWLAELGGYTGKSSGGPPGSITLARGLDRVRPVAQAIEELERSARLG